MIYSKNLRLVVVVERVVAAAVLAVQHQNQLAHPPPQLQLLNLQLQHHQVAVLAALLARVAVELLQGVRVHLQGVVVILPALQVKQRITTTAQLLQKTTEAIVTHTAINLQPRLTTAIMEQ